MAPGLPTDVYVNLGPMEAPMPPQWYQATGAAATSHDEPRRGRSPPKPCCTRSKDNRVKETLERQTELEAQWVSEKALTEPCPK